MDNEEKSYEVLKTFLEEDDPQKLRIAFMELVVAVSFWYRRATIYKMLNPILFLVGFLSCYFFVK